MRWIIFRFAVLGPAVGSITFNAAGLLFSHSSRSYDMPLVQRLGEALVDGVLIGFLGLFLAYPIGLLPAVLCGIAYFSILRAYAKCNPRPGWRLLLGGALGLAITSLYGGVLFSRDAIAVVGWAVAGTVAGMCSAVSIGNATYGQALVHD